MSARKARLGRQAARALSQLVAMDAILAYRKPWWLRALAVIAPKAARRIGATQVGRILERTAAAEKKAGKLIAKAAR